ncbi:conserved hypothetical protein [sediment metagenome]|uniref:UspA domain-containing protein n=1 Tax=sediment metagenome TaxID=749907 RepID=D9PFW2_9ZZZZ
MKRILTAIDFSDVTDEVIHTATKLAQQFGARLRILHTELPHPVFLSYGIEVTAVQDDYAERLQQDARKLEMIQEHLAHCGVQAECSVLTGSTLLCILDQARSFAADLIVVGTHSHGTLRHLFLGSVREDLIARAPCPVLVVPRLKSVVEPAPAPEREAAEAMA